jgi:hypothetical protein
MSLRGSITKRAMKQRNTRYRLENGVYYSLDTLNRKRNSLNTSDPKEARRFEGPRAARNALACFY